MGCCVSKVEAAEEDPPAVRGCTDVLWLCLFIGFWFLMILIAAFSFVYGSPLRLVNGYDSFGNTCGTTNSKIADMKLSGLDMTDKPRLFYMDIKELRKTIKICVKQCPTRNLNTLDDLRAYYKETGTKLCRYDFDFNDLDKPEIKNVPERKSGLSRSVGPCPHLPVYDSTPVLNRCVPNAVKDLSESVLREFYGLLNSWGTLEQVLDDLLASWKQLLGLTFFSLVLSLLTVSVLHLLATLVSMIIMVLVSVACVGGTGYLWFTYYQIKNNLDHTQASRMLLESVRNETAFFWYSVVATVITVILLLLMLAMCKRVDVLAELFEETSRCLAAVPALFLQPLVTFIILLVFFAFWITVLLMLITANSMGTDRLNLSDQVGTIAPTPTAATGLAVLGNITASDIKTFTLVKFNDPVWVRYMWWVYFIGLIWTSEFILACQSMVIAGAVAHWFYRNRYKDNDHVSYAVCKLLKYHLGSVAKGSFLITLFKIPRLILTYLHTKLKNNSDAGSEIAKCGLKCCICCFYCLEKFIRYLNHNAYTVVAIDGVPFCTAAGTAFDVLTSHALQVATINSIGDFILFLGKCFVTATTGILGLYLFKRNTELTFYAAPTLLTCIFAYFIANSILSLYEMVLDSLYLCRCQNNDTLEVQTTTNGTRSEPQQDQELEPINE